MKEEPLGGWALLRIFRQGELDETGKEKELLPHEHAPLPDRLFIRKTFTPLTHGSPAPICSYP